MNDRIEKMVKPFESRWGKIALVAVGVLLGALLGEPVKNFVNRAQVDIDVVSIESTTPTKSRWRMSLSPSAQQKLALEIAGEDWVNKVRSNTITYGELSSRLDMLNQFHEWFPTLEKDSAWLGKEQTDFNAFYESNHDYIRTILHYVRYIPELGPDTKTATNFFNQERQTGGLLDTVRDALVGSQPSLPRNAADIVRFAGRHQTRVLQATRPLLDALSKAVANETVIEPIPSFEVTLDATNYGGRSTSIGSVGSLCVHTPAAGSPKTVVALAVKDEPNKGPLLAPGQRQRYRLSAELKLISDEKAVASGSADFVNRLKTIRDTQVDSLKVLGPLYKSGVSECRVALAWGESRITEVSGTFGEMQALLGFEKVLNHARR